MGKNEKAVLDRLDERIKMYKAIAEAEGIKITWRDYMMGAVLFLTLIPTAIKGTYWAYKEGLIKFKWQK